MIKSIKFATAGNQGKKLHSDCKVELDILSDGGLDIQINSKVKSMFGTSIRILIKEVLSFYAIENAKVVLNDSGAIEPVICARPAPAPKTLISVQNESA